MQKHEKLVMDLEKLTCSEAEFEEYSELDRMQQI